MLLTNHCITTCYLLRTKVLELEPGDTKSLFRRALARWRLGRLALTLTLAPSLTPTPTPTLTPTLILTLALTLTRPQVQPLIEGLLPYTERHFERLDRLLQGCHFVGYILAAARVRVRVS